MSSETKNAIEATAAQLEENLSILKQQQKELGEVLKILRELHSTLIPVKETEEQQQQFISKIVEKYPKSQHAAIFSRYNRDPDLARRLYCQD